MIQSEPNYNPTQNKAPAPQLTRTRCPGCQKLFAVETDTLSAMARAGVIRAEFTCTGSLCHEAFGIDLPLPLDHSSLTILPAARITKMDPSYEPEPTVEPLIHHAPERTAVIEAPLLARSNGSHAPNVKGASAKRQIAERDCPRCGAANAASLNECVRCGIIFDRYLEANDAQIEEELALGGTRELSLLWDKTLEDYEDRIRHDRFLNASRDANALSYASKKYSQILIAAPQDDIARLMRNRIVAMISVRAESSRFPIRLSFRIPKLNSMALFGGSVLFVWGVAMPQMKNMMEIGLSLILLAIGVRLALRARI